MASTIPIEISLQPPHTFLIFTSSPEQLVVPWYLGGAEEFCVLHRNKSQCVRAAGWADMDMHRVSSP